MPRMTTLAVAFAAIALPSFAVLQHDYTLFSNVESHCQAKGGIVDMIQTEQVQGVGCFNPHTIQPDRLAVTLERSGFRES